MIKISITGPESTGKTTLAMQLSEHYDTSWVPEYAREYLKGLKREYNFDDILRIAKKQWELEQFIEKTARKLVFCDTDFIVLQIWSEVKYNKSHQWIEEMVKKQHYDLYLLTYPDLKWEYDEHRESPLIREQLYEAYLNRLKNLNVNYEVIKGTGERRLKQAIAAIDNHLTF